MDELERARAKIDAIQKARRLGSVLLTDDPPGIDDDPTKILLDVAKLSPKEAIEAYEKKMANFTTISIDPLGRMVRLYPGQTTIISGHAGSGKSTLLREQVCHWLRAGGSPFIASMEDDPEDLVLKIAATAAGVEIPNERQLTSFLERYGSRLKIWGVVGDADHRKILAMIRHIKPTHAIVDSFMCMDIEDGDLEGQRRYINLQDATAKITGCHIMLVAHPRKPVSADQEPNVYDVAGSSNFGRRVFNVLFVRRGELADGRPNIGAMLMECLKQRTFGRIGTLHSWYYVDQNQFHVDPNDVDATKYLEDDCYLPKGFGDDIPAHITNPSAFRTGE